MSGRGLGSSARKLVEAVGTIRSIDLSVPVRRGNRTVKLNLRTVAKLDPDVELLLTASLDGAVRVWSAREHRLAPLRALDGGAAYAVHVAEHVEVAS